MQSSLPPNIGLNRSGHGGLEDLGARLAELPQVPQVLELLATVRNARRLVRLGVLSPIEETSIVVDLDLAAMRLARLLDEPPPSGHAS